jgi:hypothetical protein
MKFIINIPKLIIFLTKVLNYQLIGFGEKHNTKIKIANQPNICLVKFSGLASLVAG